MLDANKSLISTSGYVTELLYELLDAHVDTLLMARELDGDPAWAAHLDYLRGAAASRARGAGARAERKRVNRLQDRCREPRA